MNTIKNYLNWVRTARHLHQERHFHLTAAWHKGKGAKAKSPKKTKVRYENKKFQHSCMGSNIQ